MESGHSEIECNSVHSDIEIFTPEGRYSADRRAKISKPIYNIVERNFNNFLNFKEFSFRLIKNRNKNEVDDTVNWLNIKWLQYRYDLNRIFYKVKLSDENFKSILIKRPTKNTYLALHEEVQPPYNRPLKIDKKIARLA